MQDGTRYTRNRRGTIEVSDDHAVHVERQIGGEGGLAFAGGFRGFLGTRKGRWCAACRRLWNAWNHECPRCGESTSEDAE
jgi:rRNA maturation endonuclease Nob1